MAKDQTSTQTVGFLLVPGFALMSYAAAVEPLRAANLISGKPLYRWWHAAPAASRSSPPTASPSSPIAAPIPSATRTWSSSAPAAIRRLFDDSPCSPGSAVSRGRASPSAASPAVHMCWPRPACSISRRATLHWEHLPAFREAFPDVAVVPSLFEIDGNRITCSGGISALDMMVALIERDHGRQLAAAVGDWFLHTHIREGFGPQRMDLRYRLGVADEKLLARAARHGDQHRDPAASGGARAPAPASRSASSSGCSTVISATVSIFITAGSGWSGPASSCARPLCPCSMWRSRRLCLFEPVPGFAHIRRAAKPHAARHLSLTTNRGSRVARQQHNFRRS